MSTVPIPYNPQEKFIFMLFFMFFFLMYLYLIPCFQSEIPSKQPETSDDINPQKVKQITIK